MTDFQAGDVVVCAHLKRFGTMWDESVSLLRKGAFYRVEGWNFIGGLMIDVKSTHPLGGWNSKRFRKLRKADDRFTEQMRALRPAKVPATLSRSSENGNG